MKYPNRIASAALIGAIAFVGVSATTDVMAASPAAEAKKTAKKKKAVKVVNNAHCPVAGSAIGSMGKGASVTHKGYKVSLCCAGCTDKFNENPDGYLERALNDEKKK